MKKLIITGIIAFVSTTIFAQPGPPKDSPIEMAVRMTDKMTETLELTEDQAAEVYQLNLKFAQQIKDDEASRKAAYQAHHDSLSGVLSEEQMEKFDLQMKKRRQMRHHKAHKKEAVHEDMQID